MLPMWSPGGCTARAQRTSGSTRSTEPSCSRRHGWLPLTQTRSSKQSTFPQPVFPAPPLEVNSTEKFGSMVRNWTRLRFFFFLLLLWVLKLDFPISCLSESTGLKQGTRNSNVIWGTVCRGDLGQDEMQSFTRKSRGLGSLNRPKPKPASAIA